MQTPASTYRLQLSPDFTFENLREILDYLDQLNIDTLYSAPFFQSMEGSTHGYDIVNPFFINTAIGNLQDFREISAKLKQKGMKWLQDIVPNHMANSIANPWIYNILEFGPKSEFYNFFDVNWEYKEWVGKIMVPILGDTLENVIKNKEFKLNFGVEGFGFQYYENVLPISANSYTYLLSYGDEKSFFETEWTENFENLPNNLDGWKEMKVKFFEQNQNQPLLKHKVDYILKTFNNSDDLFKNLLELQFFKPVYWKESEKKINFRRFFTINDLICLRMEDQKVFETYHRFIHQLCQEGLLDGLRIDHVDGLFDPKGYLDRLSNLVGENFYVIVEKILEADESLPTDWKTQGTSGYDFLAMVNNLFTDSSQRAMFEENYKKIKPEFSDYDQLVYDKKHFILHERMGGELKNLWELLENLKLIPEDKEIERENGVKALSAMLCGFPVYRIYPEKYPLTDPQQIIIDKAYKVALDHESDLKKELDLIRSIFIGQGEGSEENKLYFLQRCQQFTGPLAAKGVEDTTFYLYDLLISHNEVGDSPHVFGIKIDRFHDLMIKRQQEFPLTINATATHDTKRGEDARMRINILSEIPEEWFAKVEEWHQTNNSLRRKPDVPDKNEEYFIYQSLLGSMSFGNKVEEDFLSRTTDFLQKVLREAKEHSFWSDPNTDYEQDVFEFVKRIFEHEEFRSSFDPFLQKISFYGVINSLGQSLIKIMAPGIPDIYQGTELWDLSYVDPDNRRPVNFERRKQYLQEFETSGMDDIQDMLENYADGRIKMFTVFKALGERKSNPEFFGKAEYLPLRVSSDFSKRVISFARYHKDHWYIIAVPLNPTSLCKPEEFPLNESWADGYIDLPSSAPAQWINVYSMEEVPTNGNLSLKTLFKNFPVALIKSKTR